MNRITAGSSGSARSWRPLLAAICVAQATAIVGFDFTLPFIPLYLRQDLGVHGLGQVAMWAGVIGFGPAIPATIFGPVWGRVADRLGYRFMLLRAMTSASILIGCMGFVGSPWLLLGLRMVQGSLTGTVFAAQALVAAAVPEKEIGRSMGLLQMSVFVGATFGPVGGGAVSQLVGFRACYIGAGVLLALATLIVFLFVWEPEHQRARRESQTEPRSMRSLFAIPAFVAALALMLVSQLAGTSLFPVLPLYVADLMHTTQVAGATGWLFAASGLAGGAGSYVAGRVHRRVGLRRMLVISLALTALLIIPLAFAQSYVMLLVGRCLAAMAFGSLISLVGTLAATSTPRDAKGTAFGMMGAASSLGFGGGPLIGGAVAAAFGLRSVFVLAGLTLGLAPAALAALAVGVPALLRRTAVLAPRRSM